jgi:type I restriction enzyme S subunit
MHLLEEGFKGAGLKHISKTYIENIEIPLPPREEQEKIVQELDTVSDLLAKQKQLLAEQDTLIKSVFYDMFGDPVTNDKGWTKCLLNDVIEYIGDIGSNGSNETVAKHLIMKDEPDYAFMVRTLNLNANDFINNAKYVSEDVYNFFSKSKVFGGEIIMNKIGSAGSFWLMPDLRRPVSLGLNQLIIRLQENANIKYVYYFLKTDFGQYSIQKSLRGAVTKSITKGAVKNLVLYLPPLPLQQKFADIVEQIETQKQKIKSAISETETLFNAIMAKYFDEE